MTETVGDAVATPATAKPAAAAGVVTGAAARRGADGVPTRTDQAPLRAPSRTVPAPSPAVRPVPSDPAAGRHRVAFVIEALTVGGAERMVVAMANAFVADGVDVHVVCLAHAGELAAELGPAVRLHVLGKRPGIDVRLPPRLRRLMRRIAPDAVNSHLWVANLWTRVSLPGTGLRIVVTEHNRDAWKSAAYRRIDRALVPVTDLMIAVSEDTADFYRTDVGVPARLVHVINNGIDTARYAAGDGAALRRRWAPEGQFLIGTVGRLAAQKNHLRLVEAARRLVDAGHDVRVVIVGEGPERSRIEARVAGLGLDGVVRLTGSRTDVPDVLAALDLFVLSSDREGHPLAALEAQAAGTPVVLTRAGGNADAIARSGARVGGVLADPDARALADAIGALVTDRARLADMAAFARRHALEHFDVRRMVERYASVLG